ncbi:NAD(P)/FAD-dependent oxidoreductase [Sinomonas sp. ASV322]|uniref:phytoene desaturase family protein n=1 Tax=Sinomonas sp. ASV322 TaxID=3041920 RepID=UPI0027DC8E28|nr:NAD(P)/FAD-dependent oxidoreductase [Sinomonas sp. ASV322]MDQ4504608.1 NAD(P)/FAD-dependent oxidoreductase [Sinomonas sp. ASV322]
MTADYVVIGAGINGLVAAARLAGAGHSVTLIEARDRLGGFVDSSELTVPGFVHDTFSSWHPLFVAGAAYADLGADLHRHGLTYRNTEDAGLDAVTASIDYSPEGEERAVIAYRDPERTTAAFREPADRAAYARMLEELGERSGTIFGALGSELRSAKSFKLLLSALRPGLEAAEQFARDSLMSGRNFTGQRFTGWEADQLWTPWLLHAGLGPDHATGGAMLPLMALTMHRFGLPVVEGGAGRFVAAFAGLLAERGVRVELGCPVEGIEVAAGRAVAVETAHGRFEARRGILASTSPQALYTSLLPADVVPARVRDQAVSHRPGRAAMQIHVALDSPPAWSDARLAEVPLVHISNGSGRTGIACAEAEAGLLPASPTVVVGQQCLLDPSRAPEGKATLWLQLQELPFHPRGDAAGELDVSRGWTEELAHGYAQRVLGRVEDFAPGLRSSVVGMTVISPTDLLAANCNAVGGDPYGGSAELYQNLLWRPFPAGAGHRAGPEGLWLIGAASHPGPGLGGGSGYLVTERILADGRRRLPARRRIPTVAGAHPAAWGADVGEDGGLRAS